MDGNLLAYFNMWNILTLIDSRTVLVLSHKECLFLDPALNVMMWVNILELSEKELIMCAFVCLFLKIWMKSTIF